MTRSNEGHHDSCPHGACVERNTRLKDTESRQVLTQLSITCPQIREPPCWGRNPGFLRQVPPVQYICWSVLNWPQSHTKLARHRLPIPFFQLPFLGCLQVSIYTLACPIWAQTVQSFLCPLAALKLLTSPLPSTRLEFVTKIAHGSRADEWHRPTGDCANRAGPHLGQPRLTLVIIILIPFLFCPRTLLSPRNVPST